MTVVIINIIWNATTLLWLGTHGNRYAITYAAWYFRPCLDGPFFSRGVSTLSPLIKLDFWSWATRTIAQNAKRGVWGKNLSKETPVWIRSEIIYSRCNIEWEQHGHHRSGPINIRLIFLYSFMCFYLLATSFEAPAKQSCTNNMINIFIRWLGNLKGCCLQHQICIIYSRWRIITSAPQWKGLCKRYRTSNLDLESQTLFLMGKIQIHY